MRLRKNPWKLRCPEWPYFCHTFGPTARPCGSQSRGAIRDNGYHSQRSKFNIVVSQLHQQHAAEMEDIMTVPPGVQAVWPPKNRSGAPTIHLTWTAHEATLVRWRNGRQKTVTILAALKRTRTRHPRRLPTHNLGQPSSTARTGYTCCPDWGQSRLRFPPCRQDLQGCAASHHSQFLRGCAASHHSQYLTIHTCWHQQIVGAPWGTCPPGGCVAEGPYTRTPPLIFPLKWPPPQHHPWQIAQPARNLLVP
jgi:hypothetical protein